MGLAADWSFLPWQTVFSLDRQIGGAAFALLGVGREGDVFGRRSVDVHFIFVVRHDDNLRWKMVNWEVRECQASAAK